MKTVLATCALLALAAMPSLARDGDGKWGDRFEPREPAVKQAGHYEWAWDGKDSLALEAPATLRYTPGGSPRIVITGDDGALAHLQVGQGRIRVDRDYHSSANDRLQVTVTGVTVHNIVLAGTGHASLEKLDLDHLNLVLSGSGGFTGDGRADQANVVISGSGNFDLSHLAARTANIHISGSGKVDITPRDAINLSVSGSGTVHMTARPAHINQSITGSGGVRIDGN